VVGCTNGLGGVAPEISPQQRVSTIMLPDQTSPPKSTWTPPHEVAPPPLASTCAGAAAVPFGAISGPGGLVFIRIRTACGLTDATVGFSLHEASGRGLSWASADTASKSAVLRSSLFEGTATCSWVGTISMRNNEPPFLWILKHLSPSIPRQSPPLGEAGSWLVGTVSMEATGMACIVLTDGTDFLSQRNRLSKDADARRCLPARREAACH